MSERAYTVKELDALRRVVREKMMWGRYAGPILDEENGWSATSSRSPNPHEVEERVRTHMMAGHTADDLLASEAA